MMAQQQEVGGNINQKPMVGAERSNPLSAASPLKTEIKSNNFNK